MAYYHIHLKFTSNPFLTSWDSYMLYGLCWILSENQRPVAEIVSYLYNIHSYVVLFIMDSWDFIILFYFARCQFSNQESNLGLAVKEQSPNHWTTSEFPPEIFRRKPRKKLIALSMTSVNDPKCVFNDKSLLLLLLMSMKTYKTF